MQKKAAHLWVRMNGEHLYVEFDSKPRPGDLVAVVSHDDAPMQIKVFTEDMSADSVMGRVIASGWAPK